MHRKILIMVAMARPKSLKAKPTALRLDSELLDKLLEIGNAAPFKPTVTQLIEAAMREYVEKHSPAPKRK